MPYLVEWMDSEHTLIFVRLAGHLSTDDLRAAHAQLHALLLECDGPADVIFDPREQVFFPPRLGETMREVHQTKLPNLRLLVFVGKTLVWELYTLQARQYPDVSYTIAWADTLDDARAMVRRVRSGKTIQPLRPGSPDWN